MSLVIFVVMGIEPMVSCMLSKCFATELHPQPLIHIKKKKNLLENVTLKFKRERKVNGKWKVILLALLVVFTGEHKGL